MATKTTPILTRKIGHVPFSSVVGTNAIGRYIASAKVDNTEYMGEGDSARKATLDLQHKLEKASLLPNVIRK